MAKQPEPMKLEEGKVYLRDTRTGRVHQYEDLLAQMSYMQRFVAGEDTQQTSNIDNYQPSYNVTLTGSDKAAEWDKRASMSNEEREAYDAKMAKGNTDNTITGVVETASGQPASTPQTLTVAVPEHGATRSTEQAQVDATAPASAPETASGVVTAPAPAPAPPPPPANAENKAAAKPASK